MPLVLIMAQMARPKVKDIDESTIFRLVADNSKKRFALVWGYDPSPPKPKKRSQPKKTKTAAIAESGAVEEMTRALQVISVEPEWKELEFIKLSPPLSAFPDPELVAAYEGGEVDGQSDERAEWFIRAVQGHTLKLDSGHLEELIDDENGRQKAGLLVHGTKWQLWDTISALDTQAPADSSGDTGLNKMQRQHIHLAPALTGRITPRNQSSLLVYLDMPKMLAAGIPVYVAQNGVVLTPGKEGVVTNHFFRKVVSINRDKRRVIWENGAPSDRDEQPDEDVV